MSVVTPHATVLLEFSRDPLSDTTPTWIDITQYLLDVEWGDGKAKDLDEPQAGSMTIRLKNADRRFEPEYAAGAYYPDIVPLRRFRLSLNGTPEFLGYATSYDISYPGGTAYSEVMVQCVDGFGLLSLDALELLDPPSATTYREVVSHDEPYAYYRMRERFGTKMLPETGPEGQYRNTPLLNQTSRPSATEAVRGEADQAVYFRSVQSEFARVPLANQDTFADTNELTAECLFRAADLTTDHILLTGPYLTSISNTTWTLRVDTGADVVQAILRFQDGTTETLTSQSSVSAFGFRHVAVTWDGQTATLYMNGSIERTITTPGKTLRTGNPNDYLYIGGNNNLAQYSNGYFVEAAFHEHALSAERIQARQNARSSGFFQQAAGERISMVAASDLWVETGIQTGAHDVQPVMETGQSRLDEIRAAVKAEMPMAQFFVQGTGDPKYLGWDYRGTAPYNEPAAIFGDTSGEVPYSGIELVYDDDLFNEVTVSHQTSDEGEASHTMTDTASIDAYYRRAHAETGLILVHHADAEAVAAAILEDHKDPRFRVESLSLSGANTLARTQILTRQLGDCVRIKRRGEGGTPVDVITWIIGRSKRLDVNGHLWAILQTARGFNAAEDVWRLGIVGYTELGETAVLG